MLRRINTNKKTERVINPYEAQARNFDSRDDLEDHFKVSKISRSKTSVKINCALILEIERILEIGCDVKSRSRSLIIMYFVTSSVLHCPITWSVYRRIQRMKPSVEI